MEIKSRMATHSEEEGPDGQTGALQALVRDKCSRRFVEQSNPTRGVWPM
jgi:hypothetical protein